MVQQKLRSCGIASHACGIRLVPIGAGALRARRVRPHEKGVNERFPVEHVRHVCGREIHARIGTIDLPRATERLQRPLGLSRPQQLPAEVVP